MAYRALQRRYPHVFTESVRAWIASFVPSKPVWTTLVPVVATGCLWAGYSGVRRLTYRAKYATPARHRGKEPWDEEGKEKLVTRDTALSQASQWDKAMSPPPPPKKQ
ncbi:uncharacterized protein ACA1_366290 [Acanthamoeba castellanii str. Neff]|uniref:Uncharacterized protein n=1 Tax=Acanthamoeba castellanii (strain ATCC 30010 / Neff) TaxID=1257118 RepID=L8GLY3_ACACF|nr:uncharacterized protein ACA1_366290 [Acanthamoeba castellanii str. Neff]ELR14017.1 hypothetical protein ACA1_366290 [Acanthamoeba castellanii str. Neff]